MIWNVHAVQWNHMPERRHRKAGRRSKDGITIPDIARHPQLHIGTSGTSGTDNAKSLIGNNKIAFYCAIKAVRIKKHPPFFCFRERAVGALPVVMGIPHSLK